MIVFDLIFVRTPASQISSFLRLYEKASKFKTFTEILTSIFAVIFFPYLLSLILEKPTSKPRHIKEK